MMPEYTSSLRDPWCLHDGAQSVWLCGGLQYDFPEMPSELQGMARAAGFASMTPVFAASKRISQFLVFQS